MNTESQKTRDFSELEEEKVTRLVEDFMWTKVSTVGPHSREEWRAKEGGRKAIVILKGDMFGDPWEGVGEFWELIVYEKNSSHDDNWPKIAICQFPDRKLGHHRALYVGSMMLKSKIIDFLS